MGGSSVSVIVPTYNRAYVLPRTLRNVLDQTHPDTHAIVVDDGSTDETPRIMAEQFGSSSRITYVRQANAGVSAARNRALSMVKGDYVAFLDSDDEWAPWKIAAQLACLRALPEVGMVWTDMDSVDASGRLLRASSMRSSYTVYEHVPMPLIFSSSAPFSTLAPATAGPPANTRVHWGDAFSAMALGNLCQPSTVMITRARAERVGGFDESLRVSEDGEYHLRLCRDGQAALLDCATVRYRKGADDQLTRPELVLTIAEHHLELLRSVIEHDRARIKLPAELVEETLASAHAWLGNELARARRYDEARSHFAHSLRHRPLQSSVALKLALSIAPSRLRDLLRHAYRACSSVWEKTA